MKELIGRSKGRYGLLYYIQKIQTYQNIYIKTPKRSYQTSLDWTLSLLNKYEND